MQNIGDRIRAARLEKNYTQFYMAFMLDISQASYSKIERNETKLTLPRIYEIAEILEISPFVLMPKPKYGVGIDYHFVWRTWLKLRKFWTHGIARKKEEAVRMNILYRDISNTNEV
ncbi:helix-turn-helix transcriptional regulator [Mucilaginibacter sp. PAMB04168]|uniref:helix-turn-helix domain-containing protein n=1 Tax=Mucilaginibacter sp. PAMB04168 TaxID=3138567 RepID=UPI0031F60EEE